MKYCFTWSLVKRAPFNSSFFTSLTLPLAAACISFAFSIGKPFPERQIEQHGEATSPLVVSWTTFAPDTSTSVTRTRRRLVRSEDDFYEAAILLYSCCNNIIDASSISCMRCSSSHEFCKWCYRRHSRPCPPSLRASSTTADLACTTSHSRGSIQLTS